MPLKWMTKDEIGQNVIKCEFWIFIFIFCLYLQFLESKVGQMQYIWHRLNNVNYVFVIGTLHTLRRCGTHAFSKIYYSIVLERWMSKKGNDPVTSLSRYIGFALAVVSFLVFNVRYIPSIGNVDCLLWFIGISYREPDNNSSTIQ